MEISCNIIRDLLPLYAEDLASDDSRKLVDDHLCQCDACTKELEALKKPEKVPVEVDRTPLEKVRKGIVRRRVLSAGAAVLTLLTLAAFVISYLFAPFQLTKEQALDDFYIREDGAVVIDYSSAVMGRSLSGNNENWFINQYSTRYDTWKGENRKSLQETFGTDGIITEEECQRYENIDVIYGRWETADGKVSSDADIPWRDDDRVVEWESEKNWWYADPAGLGRDVLLHDAGKEIPNREGRYQFSPIYPMIFFGGILAMGILLILRKKISLPWAKELPARLTILCGSAVFSTLFVSSGRIFTSYIGVIDQYWGWMIGMNTVFLALTILLWRQLYLLNKQDRGK